MQAELMNQQELSTIATQSLQALNDERVMVPSQYSEAVSDLKKILRGLMSGQMVLGQQKTEPQAKEDGGDAPE